MKEIIFFENFGEIDLVDLGMHIHLFPKRAYLIVVAINADLIAWRHITDLRTRFVLHLGVLVSATATFPCLPFSSNPYPYLYLFFWKGFLHHSLLLFLFFIFYFFSTGNYLSFLFSAAGPPQRRTASFVLCKFFFRSVVSMHRFHFSHGRGVLALSSFSMLKPQMGFFL